MPQERIFYATHSVSLDNSILQGVQSVSLSSSYGVDPVFQLGQCDAVDYIQNVPEVEVTITRALIGSSPLSGLELDTDCQSAEDYLNTQKTIVIGSETGGFTVSNATISGYTVNFSTDGVFTEELTYISDTLTAGGSFSGSSDEIHLPYRPDWSGPNNATSARLTLNLNRNPVFRLGEYKPFKRFVQFPVEITLVLGYLLPNGGSTPADPTVCAALPAGTENFTLTVCDNSWAIDKARLTNIGYTGGDTGGGNVEVSYTYTTYNNITIN